MKGFAEKRTPSAKHMTECVNCGRTLLNFGRRDSLTGDTFAHPLTDETGDVTGWTTHCPEPDTRRPPMDARILTHEGYTVLKVDAGPLGVERVVPPAGEEHAFDRPLWRRQVEVSVSPAGRSVRVWVDGEEVR